MAYGTSTETSGGVGPLAPDAPRVARRSPWARWLTACVVGFALGALSWPAARLTDAYIRKVVAESCWSALIHLEQLKAAARQQSNWGSATENS